MSGIVGSYFNTRGSGVVAKLGTDGQVFTSTGAGLSQGFEAAAGGGFIKLAASTISAQSGGVSFDGYFTSEYDRYVVFGSELFCSAAHDLWFRTRESDSDVKCTLCN